LKRKIIVILVAFFYCGVLLSKSSIIWKSSQVIGTPVRVIVNENGIFIGDMKQVKIFHLDFKGKLVNTIGKQGEGPNEFTSIQNFMIHNNEIYVQSGFMIKCLTLNGEFKRKWNFTMKYTFYQFFVTDTGFVLIGKLSDHDPKVFSKSQTSPYDFFYHISFDGKLIKSFGSSFPELKQIDLTENLMILAGMTPSRIDNNIYYANHLNYQIWKAAIKTGECLKIIDEKVPYFIPFASKLKRFTSKGGTRVVGGMQGTRIRIFQKQNTLVLFVKSGDTKKGYESTYLRFYTPNGNKFKFKRQIKLKNGLNIYSYFKDIFYGFNEDGDFVALKVNTD